MDECMDRWKEGWMGRWTDGWMDVVETKARHTPLVHAYSLHYAESFGSRLGTKQCSVDAEVAEKPLPPPAARIPSPRLAPVPTPRVRFRCQAPHLDTVCSSRSGWHGQAGHRPAEDIAPSHSAPLQCPPSGIRPATGVRKKKDT